MLASSVCFSFFPAFSYASNWKINTQQRSPQPKCEKKNSTETLNLVSQSFSNRLTDEKAELEKLYECESSISRLAALCE
jgi:hypothetical protein